jgi:hypothetical protein
MYITALCMNLFLISETFLISIHEGLVNYIVDYVLDRKIYRHEMRFIKNIQ